MSVTVDKEITFRSAVYQILSKVKNEPLSGIRIYSFNVPEDQLESAHALLDNQQNRGSMKVTYSLDHNFIVRSIPGCVHNETIQNWGFVLAHALTRLTSTLPEPLPPGCSPIGATTFDFGLWKKQADGGFRSTLSIYPSLVLEVGDSESLTQLGIDAKLWLEHSTEVNLVVLISIDDSPSFTRPRIIVQLWRGERSDRLPHPGSNPRQIYARMVQNDDWTLNETPIRILLSDIFGAQIPAAYGNHSHVDLETRSLRESIISSCRL